MELLRTIVSWLVVAIGLFGWTAFLPQIRLLIKCKNSKEVAVGSYWMTFVMQAVVMTYLMLQPKIDWKLSLGYVTSIICLCVAIWLIYYYRKHPGGRT